VVERYKALYEREVKITKALQDDLDAIVKNLSSNHDEVFKEGSILIGLEQTALNKQHYVYKVLESKD
jgi:hypothetical protein